MLGRFGGSISSFRPSFED